jgi:hypothetical protein
MNTAMPAAPSLLPRARRSLCPLESLTTDALIAVMSAAYSPADLNAFIYASPVLYTSFLEGKFSILLSLASRDLGPALIDAMILTKTQERNEYLYQKQGQEIYLMDTTIDDYIHVYHRLLSSPSSAISISVETLIDIIRYNGAVQYFVDLFSTIMFKSLRKTYPACDRGLSKNERHRISQAFLRRQIMLDLWGGYKSYPYQPEKVVSNLVSLFKSWELEQISVVNSFVYSLCHALAYLEVANLGRESRWSKCDEYSAKYYCDLPALRRRMLSDDAKDDLFREKLEKVPDLGNIKQISSPTHFLNASHCSSPGHGLLLPFNDPIVLTSIDFVDDSPRNPPYGWIDALDGLSGNRWGFSLLPDAPAGGIPGRITSATQNFHTWRRLGSVLWDRDRVELMKLTESLRHYRTGWLARIWDDCNMPELNLPQAVEP